MNTEPAIPVTQDLLIQIDRARCRSIFLAAYDVFLATAQASTPSNLPDGSYSQPGGPHDPAWEKWARWRAEFQLCGQHVLHGKEERIFVLHLCMGLSRRATSKRLGIHPTSNAFESMTHAIAEKVGRALTDNGLWPLHDDLNAGYMDV